MVTWTKEVFIGFGAQTYREGVCLKDDTKPTDDDTLMNGSKLLEMDTSKIFHFDAENKIWREWS